MKVVEIFKSIDGEGIRAGLPCTFIRLFGCNLHCSYCDTRYGCEGDGYGVMSIPNILEQVELNGVKRVTVTGGEPMIHPGIEKLLQALVDRGYEVNVETNGTRFPLKIETKPTSYKLNYITCNSEPVYDGTGRVFYTMDWKCKSSEMENHMSIDAVNALTQDDVLKFVVGSVEDMAGAMSVIEQMTSKPTVFFSPVFGKIEPKEIVEYLLANKLNDCRVQIQMHKVIWDPEQKGV